MLRARVHDSAPQAISSRYLHINITDYKLGDPKILGGSKIPYPSGVTSANTWTVYLPRRLFGLQAYKNVFES